METLEHVLLACILTQHLAILEQKAQAFLVMLAVALYLVLELVFELEHLKLSYFLHKIIIFVIQFLA